jgi:hypothetical protein
MINPRNILEKVQISKIIMPAEDWNSLHDLLFYGARIVAQQQYEFIKPSYDEDAGVFTDHGQNEYSRTFANVYMTTLLGTAILDIERPEFTEENPNPPTTGYILSAAIPALSHFLVAIGITETQKRIWMAKISGDYESDGHYGRETKEEYYQTELTRHMWDRKRIRRVQDLLQSHSAAGHSIYHYTKAAKKDINTP